MTKIKTIDPIWEEKYGQGHAEKYPWDSVVSFVYRYAPRDRPKNKIRILEIGFGTASNLWFAAREGFNVTGIEGSQSAVDYAKKRFQQDDLAGELYVGDFTCRYPLKDESIDLVIDRGALVCVGKSGHEKAFAEIWRVLKQGGKFHYNGYADSHSSYRASEPGPDGVRINISAGSLVGVGQLHFTSRMDIDEMFGQDWKLLQVQRREWTNMLHAKDDIHAEWLVVAEKTSG